MADGTSESIDKVKVGDKIANAVPGADPGTRDQAHTVTAIHITHTDRDYTDVTIATPAGPAKIKGTSHHLYWDATTRAWTRADELHLGDHVQTSDGKQARITALRTYTATMVTYNLTIDGLHTYYVEAGATPVLVHNCGGYFDDHATSCTCEGIGDITYKGVDEAAANEPDDFTRHALQRLERRGVSGEDAQAVLEREPFSYYHEDQWKMGYYDPKSKVFVAKTIDGNINTVMINVDKAYIKRLQSGG